MKFTAIPLALSVLVLAEKRQVSIITSAATSAIGETTSIIGLLSSASLNGIGVSIIGTAPNSIITAAISENGQAFTVVTQFGGDGTTLPGGGTVSGSSSTTSATSRPVSSLEPATSSLVSSVFSVAVTPVSSSTTGNAAISSAFGQATSAANSVASVISSAAASASNANAARALCPSAQMLYAAGVVLGGMLLGAMATL